MSTSKIHDTERDFFRIVTKVRWVVEAINGILKNRFKYFGKRIRNTTLHSMFRDFHICCALYNMEFKPIVSDTLLNVDVGRIMLEKQHDENHMQALVFENNLKQRTSLFLNMTEDIGDNPLMDNFPDLTVTDLYTYALGTYQVKNCEKYFQDLRDEDGRFFYHISKETININYAQYHFDVTNENAMIVKLKIQSRFVRSKQRFVFVLIDQSKQGLDAILGHYCTCMVGSRVVGCCSHVMLLIWYFGFARNETNIRSPAASLRHILYRNEPSDDDDEPADQAIIQGAAPVEAEMYDSDTTIIHDETPSDMEESDTAVCRATSPP